MHPFRDVAIVGAYNTEQAKTLPGETSKSITVKAIRGALADAGMTTKDVDGLLVHRTIPSRLNAHEGMRLAYELGIRAFWPGATAYAAIPGVLDAAAAIATGQCNTVVIANGQAGIHVDHSATAPWTRPTHEFIECWGLFTAVEFALVAQRHMHLFGTTEEQMAFVAATIRNNGHKNPEAVFYGKGPYTVDDVLASRAICEPFKLLDCAITSEGGAAMVLTRADRAIDRPKPPVFILGGATEAMAPGYTYPPLWEDAGVVGRKAARKAFGMAGLTPEDVDTCELYDAFSFEIIRQFEAYGFCEEGEGGEFVTSGVIGPGEKFPTCTDGGTLSHSHTGNSQMLQKVIQSVRQVRGDAGSGQVDDAHVSVCSNAGSGSMFNPVLLVGDERP